MPQKYGVEAPEERSGSGSGSGRVAILSAFMMQRKPTEDVEGP